MYGADEVAGTRGLPAAADTPAAGCAANGRAIQAGPDRRTLLRGLAAAGAAGAAGLSLTACGGGGGDSSSTAASPSATAPSKSPATSAPASPSESPTSAAPSSPAAEALIKTADVPEGGGTILDDAKLVVTQPAAGQFKAFSAVCTHQQCLVGRVEDGLIMCPCHGSEYKITDGSVQQGPATRGLAELPVTVQGDSVVRA
jgi:Rieske Fe-S protein